MSRNLGRTSCARCGEMVKLLEAPRLITPQDAAGYFDEYKGMTVAEARCPLCAARYLAWMSVPPQDTGRLALPPDGSIHDLSYLSSFGCNPGEWDLPQWVAPRTREFAATEADLHQSGEDGGWRYSEPVPAKELSPEPPAGDGWRLVSAAVDARHDRVLWFWERDGKPDV